jgi:hypothetical protein
MKKAIVFLLFMTGLYSKAGAQTMSIQNALSCTIKVFVYAHASGGACGSHASMPFTIASSTGTSFNDEIDVNNGSCLPAGTGPGWQGGYCFTSLTGADWDYAMISIFGTTTTLIFGPSIPPGCSSVTTVTGLDCLGNTITATWDATNYPNIAISVY